jgi:hypothetical protein
MEAVRMQRGTRAIDPNLFFVTELLQLPHFELLLHLEKIPDTVRADVSIGSASYTFPSRTGMGERSGRPRAPLLPITALLPLSHGWPCGNP